MEKLCTGMARVVRKVNFCYSLLTFMLFFSTFCLTMVAGLEWNVLEIPGPRPKPGDQLDSHQKSVGEFAAVHNKSRIVTAYAKIIHRYVSTKSSR